VQTTTAELAPVIPFPVGRRGTVRTAAFFDVDRTLLPGSSLFPLAQEMYRRGHLDLRRVIGLAADQVRFRLGGERNGGVVRARAAALQAIRGCRREWLIEIARSVVRERLLPRVYPGALDLIEQHRGEGRLVFLASSSPQDYLALLAHELEATRLEVRDSVYTGRLRGPLCHGRHKAERVASMARALRIDLERSFAYSDSASDIPLLDLVGCPVAVNPDAALAKEAAGWNWKVVRFAATPRGSRRGVRAAEGLASF
jgi:HAD superfamily hydrolase (TIGR01490 family)